MLLIHRARRECDLLLRPASRARAATLSLNVIQGSRACVRDCVFIPLYQGRGQVAHISIGRWIRRVLSLSNKNPLFVYSH